MTWTPALEAELRELILKQWRRDQQRNEHVASACQGKSRFNSPELANRSSLYRRATHSGLQPYRCRFCGFWHIGTTSMAKKRGRVRPGDRTMNVESVERREVPRNCFTLELPFSGCMDRKERAVDSRDTVEPRYLIDARCDWHLSNWARWMHNYQVCVGYGSKSAVVTGYGSMSIDDMYDAMDMQHAKIIDAIVDGLTEIQRCAIHNVYLADVWRSGRGMNMTDVFVEAADEVWRLARKRGLG